MGSQDYAAWTTAEHIVVAVTHAVLHDFSLDAVWDTAGQLLGRSDSCVMQQWEAVVRSYADHSKSQSRRIVSLLEAYIGRLSEGQSRERALDYALRLYASCCEDTAFLQHLQGVAAQVSEECKIMLTEDTAEPQPGTDLQDITHPGSVQGAPEEPTPPATSPPADCKPPAACSVDALAPNVHLTASATAQPAFSKETVGKQSTSGTATQQDSVAPMGPPRVSWDGRCVIVSAGGAPPAAATGQGQSVINEDPCDPASKPRARSISAPGQQTSARSREPSQGPPQPAEVPQVPATFGTAAPSAPALGKRSRRNSGSEPQQQVQYMQQLPWGFPGMVPTVPYMGVPAQTVVMQQAPMMWQAAPYPGAHMQPQVSMQPVMVQGQVGGWQPMQAMPMSQPHGARATGKRMYTAMQPGGMLGSGVVQPGPGYYVMQ